jgi:uncharacterized protein YdhG (YjbR/CyaY superfamily)
VSDGDRTRHWPAIERRYGQHISHWLDLVAERAEQRYPEQLAYLMEEHGFSRTHANAVVMYARGSTSSRRFDDLEGYLAGKDPVGAATVRAMLDGLVARHPGTHVEIAWNQPFLTRDGQRLFSVGVQQGHLLAAPWSVEVLDRFRKGLEGDHGLTVNRKTFRLPLDWTIDTALLDAMVDEELAR